MILLTTIIIIIIIVIIIVIIIIIIVILMSSPGGIWSQAMDPLTEGIQQQCVHSSTVAQSTLHSLV